MNLDGAIEVVIEGGYGSKFDLAQMLIWICDECIEEKMKERVIMINLDVNYSYKKENEDNV